MLLASWLYNSALTVVVSLGLWALWRLTRTPAPPRRWPRIVMIIAMVAGLAVVLGRGLGGDPFGWMRLWCWGIFVHAPMFAFIAAGLLWRSARRWAVFGFTVGVALVAIGVDAFFIEPTWLEVTHYQIATNKLTRPLKIVVIADFQTDRIGDYERRVLAEAKAQRPDLILWAGDYLQERDAERWEQLRDELRAALAEADLSPPLGSYAVGGNVDSGLWPEIFAGSAVEVFPETRTVERDAIAITGLAMRESFQPDAAVTARERFHIVLGHCPDFALGDVHGDLLVAGHIHGGQVRLPLIGPLLTLSKVPRRWATGVTRLERGRTLAVSRGIGLERSSAPRLRFRCRPELMVLHVTPSKTRQD